MRAKLSAGTLCIWIGIGAAALAVDEQGDFEAALRNETTSPSFVVVTLVCGVAKDAV